MSNRNEYTVTDARQAQLDTALHIAILMAEANQHLFNVQREAAKAAFAQNSKHLKALLKATNPAVILTEWAGLYQTNVRRVLDVSRVYFEILPKTQAERVKKVDGPVRSLNKETQQYLDELMKTMSDGREAAAVQMNDFLATAFESVSMTQPANEETVALIA